MSRPPSLSRMMIFLSGLANAMPRATDDALPIAPKIGKSRSRFSETDSQYRLGVIVLTTTASPRSRLIALTASRDEIIWLSLQ